MRILWALSNLLVLLTFLFGLLRFAPGGPFDSDRVLPAEVEQALRARYGLDQSLLHQWWTWITRALQGDFQESIQHPGRTVGSLIAEALPPSLILGSLALVGALIIGIALGALAASRGRSLLDRVILWWTGLGIHFPSFLLASLLVILFSTWLEWLPPALWEGPETWILPAISLGFRPFAQICHYTRRTCMETYQEDFIRSARARGVSETRILLKHVLKNSLIPVATHLGPWIAYFLTGSFVVELIFQIPGLGKLFVTSILNRDYPLAMGVTSLFGVFLIVSHEISDRLCRWLDPRLEEAEGG
jgi:oligopeptide transport system permease protein